MKKNFEELVEIWDKLLKEAESKLPPVDSFPEPIIRIPVIIEKVPTISLEEYEYMRFNEVFTNILEYTFKKMYVYGRAVGWVRC